MSAIRIIAYIAAAILIFFGILFIWGAFDPNGSFGWIPVGTGERSGGFRLNLVRQPAKTRCQAGNQVTSRLTCREMSVWTPSNANPVAGLSHQKM